MVDPKSDEPEGGVRRAGTFQGLRASWRGLPRRRKRLTRAGVGLVLVVVVALVVVVVGGSGNKSPKASVKKPGVTACGCAGYMWRGKAVRSVSATWKVPRVAPTAVGSASTWIAVQTDNVDGPFIQIGTREERGTSGAGSAAAPAQYAAFWSDADHHYRPVLLGSLQPGNIVNASLSFAHGQWRLLIVDHHLRLSMRLSTRQEASTPLPQAEWLQEDNRTTPTSGLFPYPQLSAVTFQDLLVNGKQPGNNALPLTWASPSTSLVLLPGDISQDAFTIDQTTH